MSKVKLKMQSASCLAFLSTLIACSSQITTNTNASPNDGSESVSSDGTCKYDGSAELYQKCLEQQFSRTISITAGDGKIYFATLADIFFSTDDGLTFEKCGKAEDFKTLDIVSFASQKVFVGSAFKGLSLSSDSCATFSKTTSDGVSALSIAGDDIVVQGFRFGKTTDANLTQIKKAFYNGDRVFDFETYEFIYLDGKIHSNRYFTSSGLGEEVQLTKASGITGDGTVKKYVKGNGSQLFVSTVDGLFLSQDSGVNYSKVATGIQGVFEDLFYTDGKLYGLLSAEGNGATKNMSIAISTDNGSTFQIIEPAQMVKEFVDKSGGQPETKLLPNKIYAVGGKIFVGANGFYSSTDNGQTFVKSKINY